MTKGIAGMTEGIVVPCSRSGPEGPREMPATATGINRNTPVGATLTAGGATFRLWAPEARQVFVLTGTALRAAGQAGFVPSPDDAMVRIGDGSWGAFVADL